MIRVRAAAFVAAVCGALGLGAVLAHAEPVRVTPGNGAVLSAPPAVIEVVMSEEMTRQAGANTLELADASGKVVSTQPAALEPNQRRSLTLGVPPGLPAGKYTVRWQTLSAVDSDKASGTLQFTVDPTAPPAAGTVELRGGGDGDTVVGDGVSTTSSSGTPWVLVIGIGTALIALGAFVGYLVLHQRE